MSASGKEDTGHDRYENDISNPHRWPLVDWSRITKKPRLGLISKKRGDEAGKKGISKKHGYDAAKGFDHEKARNCTEIKTMAAYLPFTHAPRPPGHQMNHSDRGAISKETATWAAGGLERLAIAASIRFQEEYPDAYADFQRLLQRPEASCTIGGTRIDLTKRNDLTKRKRPTTQKADTVSTHTATATSTLAITTTDNLNQEKMEGQWRKVHEEMGGSEVVFIGEKMLRNSDKSGHQGRLLLNQDLHGQIYSYVTQKEREVIEAKPAKNEGGNSVVGLRVEVLDWRGRRYKMKCKYRWSQKGIVFNGRGWGFFQKNHHLLPDDEHNSILIFGFRVGEQLCFLFICN